MNNHCKRNFAKLPVLYLMMMTTMTTTMTMTMTMMMTWDATTGMVWYCMGRNVVFDNEWTIQKGKVADIFNENKVQVVEQHVSSPLCSTRKSGFVHHGCEVDHPSQCKQ